MKLLLVPEIVNVASVWVDQVAKDKRPPTAEPDRRALMVAFVGKLAGAEVVEVADEVVEVADEVVVVDPPDFGGYLIPEEGQLPAKGASIATNVPSMTEPFRLKYQLMPLRAPDVQSSAGVNPPDAVLRAEVRVESV